MGSDSTAEHTADEHLFLGRYVECGISALVAGTGFTINSMTELRLTGTLDVHWTWS